MTESLSGIKDERGKGRGRIQRAVGRERERRGRRGSLREESQREMNGEETEKRKD